MLAHHRLLFVTVGIKQNTVHFTLAKLKVAQACGITEQPGIWLFDKMGKGYCTKDKRMQIWDGGLLSPHLLVWNHAAS